MTNYIPFLKAKRGEFKAMGTLTPQVKLAICPFFDFPRKKIYNSESYSHTTDDIVAGLKKHWGTDLEFYFDDLDIEQSLTVENEEPYAYVLNALKDFQVIPVVGLDRDLHNNSVYQLKRSGEISSSIIAFRVVQDDFEDFDLNKDQINEDLSDVFSEFDKIDLILDCRVCSGMDITSTAQQISAFVQKFSKFHDIRRIIVTGSSIPASISELTKPNTAVAVSRRELSIISKSQSLTTKTLLIGDYTTVSPYYSDADFNPGLFQKVTAPKLIYSFNGSHYIARGISLQAGGQMQYAGLTQVLCGQNFFRGRGYSSGDEYFHDKSMRLGKKATNSTVVTPTVVAHITYMVLDAKL